MKRVALMMITLVLMLAAVSAVEPAQPRKAYAGINPYALSAFLPTPYAANASVMGLLIGHEPGIALYGGLPVLPAQDLELRLSTGPASLVDWEIQAQLGYLWYPGESFWGCDGGPVIGLFVRSFAWNNSISGNWLLNHVPELVAGWRFWCGDLAVDLRLGWNIAGLTWDPRGRYTPGIALTDFPTNLSLSGGIAWGFRAR